MLSRFSRVEISVGICISIKSSAECWGNVYDCLGAHLLMFKGLLDFKHVMGASGKFKTPKLKIPAVMKSVFSLLKNVDY